MPRISLVICVYKERDLLARLLREAEGCYDDLVVVHDGSEDDQIQDGLSKPAAIDYSALTADGPIPDGYRVLPVPPRPGSIHALVHERGGHFFEGGRSFQQEPHWPFAWSRARHDWILRLDADEFPSVELKAWLQEFRRQDDSSALSGYACFWPLWDGARAVTQRWPGGRNFLFHRQRVTFIGMVELAPMPDGEIAPVEHVLHHQPKRKSYGVRNILFRCQAYHWRRVIAQSLMGKPTDLPCWRWRSEAWPKEWVDICSHPLRHGLRALMRYPLRQLLDMHKARQRPILSACLNPGLHHAMLGWRIFLEKRRRKV